MVPDRHTFDPWHRLRQVTPARIALGRAGGSLPTRELLDFQHAHAAARDAVHQVFDPAALAREVAGLGRPVTHVRTRVTDRKTYLVRPDLGRKLDERDAESLERASGPGADVSLVLSDGLSALAAHRQIPLVLNALVPLLDKSGFTLAPIVIVPFGRVAVQDEVGERLGARASVILLGERPGLGSADSLGAYLVYGPRVGRTDAERNCVSNIRAGGLAPEEAAELIHYLIAQAIRRGISGVGLKDERGLPAIGREDSVDCGGHRKDLE
jgi:ethanolamine ammonia-lyase small subunit